MFRACSRLWRPCFHHRGLCRPSPSRLLQASAAWHARKARAAPSHPVQDAALPQPPPLRLREYQEECVQSVLGALRDGRRQIGVSLATGAGKTVIFTELLGRVPSQIPDANQTLILVHRRELVEQAARHCRSRYPRLKVEIEMGNMHASGTADITIASVQSIISRDRIEKFDPSKFKLILVDEAHHIVASAYLRVLDHFGLQSENIPDSAPALVGVSATFARFDGLALGKAIKHIVYHKDYVDMIGEKWLSDVIFTTVKSNADISRVRTTAAGDFVASSLSKAVNTDETNLITVRSWLTRASERKSTLGFCVDLAHVESLTNMFRRHGIDARFVTGDTPKAIRAERLQAFRNREFPVLLNCGVFTEGTDIPCIDCVLLARPTRSRNLLVQMIGRGMRLYPGKLNCHVIDMVASLEGGILTTPTLFGLDPDEMVDNADPEKMRNLRERADREQLRDEQKVAVQPDASITQRQVDGTVKFVDYDSVNELIDDTSGERYIRVISKNAWVHVNDDRYVLLDGSTGSYLTVQNPSGNLFEVKLIQKLTDKHSTKKIAPFARPRMIAQAQTLESAIQGADTYASEHFVRVFIALHTPGNWRGKEASEAQIAFLNRFRNEDDQLNPSDISKGKAGDMITKIKFGARGRFKQMVSAKRRGNRAAKKTHEWDQLRKKEVVRVGPVKGATTHQRALNPTGSRLRSAQHEDPFTSCPARPGKTQQ